MRFVTASLCWLPAGRLLTVRKNGGVRFQLPGGKLEPGETPRLAAVRETLEEVGLRVAADDLVELGTYTAEAANEPGATVLSTVFLAPRQAEVTGEPAALAEIAELAWTLLDERGSHLAPLLVQHVLPELRARSAAGGL